MYFDTVDKFEVLAIEEFCRRLDICQSQVYRLRNEGKLVPGRHYIKIGKVVRYFWSMEVLRDIHSAVNGGEGEEPPPQNASPEHRKPPRRPGRVAERVNWDID